MCRYPSCAPSKPHNINPQYDGHDYTPFIRPARMRFDDVLVVVQIDSMPKLPARPLSETLDAGAMFQCSDRITYRVSILLRGLACRTLLARWNGRTSHLLGAYHCRAIRWSMGFGHGIFVCLGRFAVVESYRRCWLGLHRWCTYALKLVIGSGSAGKRV